MDKERKIVFAKDGEKPEEAIQRVRAQDEADGLDTSKIEYVFDDKNTSDVEGLTEEQLRQAQRGEQSDENVDHDKNRDLPPPAETEFEPYRSVQLFTLDKKMLKTSSTLKTALTIENLKVYDGFKWRWSPELMIGTFANQLEFMQRMDELASKLIERYGVQLVGVKTVPKWGLFRAPDGLGFDDSILSNMRPKDYDQYVGHFRENWSKQDVFEPDGSVSAYLEDMPFNGHPLEAKMVREMSEVIRETNLHEVKDFHQFIMANISSRERHLLPLPFDLDPRFTKFYFPQLTVAYKHFMDKNIFFRQKQVHYHAGMVRSAISVDVEHFSKTFSSIMTAVGVSITSVDRVSSIANGLRSSDATTLLHALLTVGMMRRWCEIELQFDVNPSSFDLQSLVHCIFLKLLVPRQFLSEESVIRVDNFLLVHLMRYDLNQTSAAAPYKVLSTAQLNIANRNYLSECYEAGLFMNASQHSPFLYSNADSEGAGWNIPVTAYESIPTVGSVFEGPGRQYRSMPLNGYHYLDDFTDPPQHANFQLFNTFLQTMTRSRNGFQPALKPREKEAIVGLLQNLGDKVDSIRETYNRCNTLLFKLGVIPTSNVERGSGITGERVRLPVRLNSAMALMLLAPEVSTSQITEQHYMSGVVILDKANELAVVYDDIRNKYKKFKTFFTKSRINDMVKQRVNSDILSPFFDHNYSAHLNDLLALGALPTAGSYTSENSVSLRLMNMARSYIQDNLETFGVAKRFYYVPNPKDMTVESPKVYGNVVYDELYVVNPASLHVTTTFHDYEELYDAVIHDRMYAIFKNARDVISVVGGKGVANGAILFDFPIHLSVAETLSASLTGFGLQNMNMPIKLEVAQGSNQSGLLQTLQFVFSQNDPKFREDVNRRALLAPPNWLIDYIPEWIENVNFQMSDTRHMLRVFTDYKIFDVSELQFSSRTDI